MEAYIKFLEEEYCSEGVADIAAKRLSARLKKSGPIKKILTNVTDEAKKSIELTKRLLASRKK